MPLRKLFAALLCLIYVYTNQLGIHAFALHGETIQANAHTITQEDCWDHDTNSSMECITQWKNVVSSYDNIDINSIYIAYINSSSIIFPITQKDLIDKYYFSIHDPGRGVQWVFSKFIDDLYGKGIIMID